MITMTKRTTATLAASALVASGLTFASLAPTAKADVKECVAPDDTITVFGFNDFHGRVFNDLSSLDNPSGYLAGRLFTPVEQARAAQGEDHVLLLSSGDNIGASTFVSMMADDNPTLDIMNAAGLEASTVGNHEFDKGWSDLAGHVAGKASGFSYLGANVYTKGTTTVPAPLKAYDIITKAGIDIAIVGAVTGDVPSLVSPGGITDLTFGDPVEAVNRVTEELLDGDPANGEADIVLASFHEGAANSKLTAAENAASSAAFDDIYRKVDSRVAAIFNGHTHQLYSWDDVNGRPLLQAKSYADNLAKLDLEVDTTAKALCSATGSTIEAAKASDESFPRIKEINEIAAAAYTVAMEKGQRVIGDATEAISTPLEGNADTRFVESPMSNMVAQMFKETLGADDDTFIGVQNPGGTRDSFDKGDITFREAALTLPFANSLFTTQITGAQFKTVLEQQWQRDPEGNVPSRPFLALGLSDNVSYTYDESLPEGSRITSIMVNGQPIDPAGTYTIGSGSFLISGGDNFVELGKGKNTKDTGLTDLETWVGWVEDNSPHSPDYTMRGVSTKAPAGPLVVGGPALTFTFGQALKDGVAPQTLDMLLAPEGAKVSPQLFNSTVEAYLGSTLIGTGKVTDGVGTVSVQLPAGFALPAAKARAASETQMLRFVVKESGTEILWPMEVKDAGSTPTPKPPTKPGPPSTGG